MKNVAIIGAGAAGLMAAQVLAQAGFKVDIYEKMASPARKFLLAGRGGLNLTHSEDFEKFVTRYGAASGFMRLALEGFTPQQTQQWAQDLGEACFTGSSGRVFPQSFKASPLLRNWLRRLADLGVTFHFKYTWQGEGLGDVMLLAMGGGSWARLGSDGGFVKILRAKGVEVKTLQPSNMGFTHQWSEIFKAKNAGQPLKSCVFSFQGQSIKGEAMITQNGIEGGAIYALSSHLREEINAKGEATLRLDLKPDLSLEKLQEKLKGKDSLSNRLRKAGLNPLMISLFYEKKSEDIAALIKNYPLTLTGFQGIERAISSAGGIALDEINANFSLKKHPDIFVAGEMIDFEAPTGGYLLQGAFASGVAAARGIMKI